MVTEAKILGWTGYLSISFVVTQRERRLSRFFFLGRVWTLRRLHGLTESRRSMRIFRKRREILHGKWPSIQGNDRSEKTESSINKLWYIISSIFSLITLTVSQSIRW